VGGGSLFRKFWWLRKLFAIDKEKQLQEINEALKELGPQVKLRTDSTLSKPA